MASKKPVLQAATVQRKDYSYTLGNIKLSFTLRTDVKMELKAWLDLMERAREDIVKDLAEMK